MTEDKKTRDLNTIEYTKDSTPSGSDLEKPKPAAAGSLGDKFPKTAPSSNNNQTPPRPLQVSADAADLAEKLRVLMRGYENKFPQQLVDQFPRIVKNIVSLWHSPPDMRAYFAKLMIAERSNRQGFPPAIASELFALSHVYDEIHGPGVEGENTWLK